MLIITNRPKQGTGRLNIATSHTNTRERVRKQARVYARDLIRGLGTGVHVGLGVR